MKCVDISNELSAYAEGALSRPRAVLVWLHVMFFPGCKERLRAMREMNSALSAALQEPVQSPDIADAAMTIISASSAPAAPAKRWRLAAALAAAAAIAAVLALLYHQPQKPKPATARAPGRPERAVPAPPQIPQHSTAPRPAIQEPIVPNPKPRESVPVARDVESSRPLRAPHAVRDRTMDQAPARRPTEDELAPAEPELRMPEPQMIVVIFPPEKQEPPSGEVEITDRATGTVTYNSESYDDRGELQVISMSYTPTDYPERSPQL